MGSVQIFALRLAHLTFVCRRVFTGGYQIDAGAFGNVPLSIESARKLADTAARIRSRARVAVAKRGDMEPGALYRRELPTANGVLCRMEIGITDSGDAVYFEVGDARVRLDEQEAQDLVHVLARLRDDVAAIHTASEPPRRSYSPGRDYVSRWLPYWD
jgi:hypothetical protein